MSDACVSIRESSCTHYYQEFIEGTSYAALFVAAAGRAALIGLTRQLVGETALGAKPFHYCGSIGPVPTGRGLTEHTARLGAVLAAEFELVGLFGVDGVIADGVFWPVEVNPRYTASVEVLELALGVPLVALHRDACTRGVSWSDIAGRCAASAPIPKPLGKAILYAPQDIETPDFAARINLSLNTVVQKRVCENEPAVLDLRSDGSQITEGQKPPARKRLGISDPIRYGPVLNYAGRWPVPVIADVPHAGERIEAGRPICTVFAEADTVAACRDKLLSAAAEIYAECQAARKAR
jgi:predicted ATP-grasp superfamily ATP-dependent carboligase